MIIDINEETLRQIHNPEFAEHASTYVKIYQDFLDQVRRSGIEIDRHTTRNEAAALVQNLASKSIVRRNDDKSLYLNWISPACEACQKAQGSVTMFISLMCNRNCYFCFNANQNDYKRYSRYKRNFIQELEQLKQSGHKVDYLALTGGEPTLHQKEMSQFFAFGRQKFPQAHMRLYTSGDFLDQTILQELARNQLDEIRFSIKLEDAANKRLKVLDTITLAQRYVPNVLVEMPVLPGSTPIMQDLLRELDKRGVHGINLLEFCYPFHNADIYRQQGFKIKPRPFRILYDYWYAGALPVAHSEQDCLKLLEFAADEGLKLGVHYCSLENKNTGQIYRQNVEHQPDKIRYFSPKDFFLKSAKVYGRDVSKVKKALHQAGYYSYQYNREYRYLEFHVSQIPKLQNVEVEIGISSTVVEKRKDGNYLRELKLDLTYPKLFNFSTDV